MILIYNLLNNITDNKYNIYLINIVICSVIYKIIIYLLYINSLVDEVKNLKNEVKINNIKINKYQDNISLLKNKINKNDSKINIHDETILLLKNNYSDININYDNIILQNNTIITNNNNLLNKIDSIDKQSSFILLGFEDFLDKNNFYRQKYFFNHKNCTSNELFNNIKGSYRKNHFTYLILSQLALLPNIKENGIYLKDIVNTSIILITNKNCCKLTEYDINNIQWFHDKNNTISFKPDENLYTSNQEQIEKVEKCLLEYGIKLIKDTM
tara:strand:- start:206 stop:1015 length:810 start_codon:yes stop_codon:yes gene_type:complete